ncbi:HWE histidine kinase domain-containing protein [Agrobacterium pusense]|uniref:HWE histidine kinase domain-containing protein n=1 Tax=Agrobacterium pusense TaxID=648995 RepID=UPI002E1988E5|nr:HWE histidine kinase domain-containing protein [Agrobacterium pusense]
MAEEDLDAFQNEVRPMIRRGETCERILRLRNQRNGSSVPALFTMFPLRGPEDRVVGYGIVSRDITAQQAEERRRQYLFEEALHRMKNSLAITRSIVMQTLKNAASLQEGGTAISERVMALARAQDLLRPGQESSARITDVVESAILPHDPGGGRIRFDGPPEMLSAQQTQGLSLALHELATNAAKYGALQGDEGTIEIQWTVSDSGRFRLEWQESGGPEVSTPGSSGFGSTLMRSVVGPYFHGRVEQEFASGGMRFLLEGKLDLR